MSLTRASIVLIPFSLFSFFKNIYVNKKLRKHINIGIVPDIYIVWPKDRHERVFSEFWNKIVFYKLHSSWSSPSKELWFRVLFDEFKRRIPYSAVDESWPHSKIVICAAIYSLLQNRHDSLIVLSITWILDMINIIIYQYM